ncbi:hypothetical protein ACIF6K_14315 [Streptomyces sp. NPDC085942]|uniref:hypothetical protein n=1 Tax=Streptomyces sp. NPDC085942 TaxID=3365743 RepID=UPI0037CCF555
MAEGASGGKPQPRRTDFESMTHQQLAALIASANPAGASNLASRLSQASSTITKIGEDLKAYVAALPWHGEGGDAFRAWGGQTASATLRLGEYSKGASRWMEEVALAIGEAKAAMPPVSETTQARNALTKADGAYDTATDPANRNDPDARGLARTAQSDAAAAEARIDALRGEAALRLRKLAQTYEFTAHQVNAETPPTFPPPAAFGPGWNDNEAYRRPPGGSRAADGSSAIGEGPAASARPMTGEESVTGATRPVRSGSVADLPRSEIGGPSEQSSPVEPLTRMEIDGLAALPTATPPSSGPSPASPPPVGATAPLDMQPTPTLPVAGSGGAKASWQSAPPVTGRPGQIGGRPPALPVQGPVGPGAAGRLPHDSGIVGGRPMPPNATGAGKGMPRGLVVGGEGTAGGRGPIGHTPAMGPGNGGARPGASGGGRRYAYETGGIGAGNPRQTSRPGVPPVVGGGAMARPVSTTPPGRGEKRGSDRPDYLIEDEENWKNGRRIVPPVVE